MRKALVCSICFNVEWYDWTPHAYPRQWWCCNSCNPNVNQGMIE